MSVWIVDGADGIICVFREVSEEKAACPEGSP